MGTRRMLNEPSAPDWAVREVPLATSRAVTAALDITAPEGSVTVPEIVPVVMPCPWARTGKKESERAKRATTETEKRRGEKASIFYLLKCVAQVESLTVSCCKHFAKQRVMAGLSDPTRRGSSRAVLRVNYFAIDMPSR